MHPTVAQRAQCWVELNLGSRHLYRYQNDRFCFPPPFARSMAAKICLVTFSTVGALPVNTTKDLSTAEAARELGVSIKTVQQWMEKGVISGWKTAGGHRRVNVDEVRSLAASRRRDRRGAGHSGCTVLVIEDDPDVCRLYEIMSRSWRIAVDMHFAHDGMAGLIAIGRVQPHFVVVDLNIPKVDGYQLIGALSEQPRASAPHYCVITGMTRDAVGRNGTLPEGCPILTKPVDFAALESLIERAYADSVSRRGDAAG